MSEAEAIERYLICKESSNAIALATSDQERTNIVQTALEEHENRKKARTSASKYRCLKHIACTSNICERLFSQAKLILTDRRSSMKPKNLNMVLFLKTNMDLWDARTIDMIRNVSL